MALARPAWRGTADTAHLKAYPTPALQVPNWPAVLGPKVPGMLVVGAVGDDPTDVGSILSVSNYGAAYVNVAAPGIGIISTYIRSRDPDYPKPEDLYDGQCTPGAHALHPPGWVTTHPSAHPAADLYGTEQASAFAAGAAILMMSAAQQYTGRTLTCVARLPAPSP